MIPEGFVPILRSSPYLESLGSFYSQGAGGAMRLGVHVEARATNARGLAHGGFLAGLADIALGYALATSQEPHARLVTSSLSLDFAGSAKIGDWIQTSVDLQHVGRQLGFANAYLTVAGRRIVRASGVFLRADARVTGDA